MGTGQMIMAIGAMVLFSTLALSLNMAIVTSDESMIENGMGLTALGIAERLVEEAQRLSFDETLIGGAPADPPDGFTPADEHSMGPELGETYPAGFDDLDDFNGFDQTITVGGESFRVRASVGYVDPTNPLHVAEPRPGPVPAWDVRFAPSPTFVKELEVRVSSSYPPVTISLNHLFAYRP